MEDYLVMQNLEATIKETRKASKKILKDIERTGHPLELDVIDTLLDAGWSVLPQYLYIDDRTRKPRTIDVVSFYGKEYTKKTPMLILECKTTEKPWVFYSSFSLSDELAQLKHDPERWGKKGINVLYLSAASSILDHLIPKDEHSKEKLARIPAGKIMPIFGQIHYQRNEFLTHSCHVAFRKHAREDSPDDFQKAIYQIKEASSQITETYPGVPIFKAGVLKGKIFQYMKIKRQAKLKPRNHVLFSTFWIKPTKVQKYFPTEYTFTPMIVDILLDSYLADYLKLLKEDIGCLKALTEMIERVMKNI